MKERRTNILVECTMFLMKVTCRWYIRLTDNNKNNDNIKVDILWDAR